MGSGNHCQGIAGVNAPLARSGESGLLLRSNMAEKAG
jgi:hypothetical protein